MSFQSVKICNFKSFNSLFVDFDKFNVLIGANSSGKSNFLQLLRFLRDIRRHGLDYAIAKQGGIEYIKNHGLPENKDISIELAFGPKGIKFDLQKGYSITNIKYKYKLVLKIEKKGYSIKEEIVSIYYNIQKKKKGEKNPIINEHLQLRRKKNIITISPRAKKSYLWQEVDFISYFFKKRKKYDSHRLIIEGPYFSSLPSFVGDLFHSSIFDFDPKKSKKAAPYLGATFLSENGDNLAVIVQEILKDKEKENEFFALVRNILPHIKKLKVEDLVDKSSILFSHEKYASNKTNKFPAFLLSDGTINIISLIVALFFGKRKTIIIEEPERNLHPQIISKIVKMMQDASEKKQIFITTHNPEIVRYVDLSSLYLVTRNVKGFSNIEKPVKSDRIKEFLRNDLGVAELYLQGLLEE